MNIPNKTTLLRLRINLMRLMSTKIVEEFLLIVCSAFLFVVFIFLLIYLFTFLYMEFFLPIPTAFNDYLIPTAFNDYLIT